MLFSGGRFPLLRLAASVLTAVLLLGSGARAEPESLVSYHIEATDLASALNQFAQQSQKQIVFASTTTAGKHIHPLHGAYLPREALDSLLRGSGISYRIYPDDLIVVSVPGEQRLVERR